MNLVMVLGIIVCVSLSISVCMLIVSNAMLMSNATVTVCSGGSFWLKNQFLVKICCNCIVDAV